jgi:hypothetical protein
MHQVPRRAHAAASSRPKPPVHPWSTSLMRRCWMSAGAGAPKPATVQSVQNLEVIGRHLAAFPVGDELEVESFVRGSQDDPEAEVRFAPQGANLIRRSAMTRGISNDSGFSLRFGRTRAGTTHSSLPGYGRTGRSVCAGAGAACKIATDRRRARGRRRLTTTKICSRRERWPIDASQHRCICHPLSSAKPHRGGLGKPGTMPRTSLGGRALAQPPCNLRSLWSSCAGRHPASPH